MNKDKIIETLKRIFFEYFNIVEEFKEENFDKILIRHFSFNYTDLLYLYILIEKTFNININNRLLKGYKFSTINDITKVIMDSTSI